MLLVTTLVPLNGWVSGGTLAHWNKRLAHLYSTRDRAHYGHRHSRAWWRRRAKRRRARTLAILQRRRLAAAQPNALAASGSNQPTLPGTNRAGDGFVRSGRSLPNLAVPAGWTSQATTRSGEMRFHLRTADGQSAGTAVLTPVTASGVVANDSSLVGSVRAKTLAGVPFRQLRRVVIDRMIAEGGWVTNDMEREIDGHRVYVALAQSATPAGSGRLVTSQPGPITSWTFYFTEVDGRIYNLATNAPLELSPLLVANSEQVVASLHTANRGTLAGIPLR